MGIKLTNMEPANFDQNRKDSFYRAKKKVASIKGFYEHLIIYIVINLFLLDIHNFKEINFDDNFWKWKTFNVAIFWGIGLLMHYFNVFGFNFILGKKWEERKIKELMENDKLNK